MIFSIDHIALSPPDSDSAALALVKLGYSMVFQEKERPNLAIKRNFMHSFTSVHSLALMRKDGSIPIEIVNHGYTNGKPGYVIPVVGGLPQILRGPWDGMNAPFRKIGTQCSVPPLGARVFVSTEDKTAFAISGAVVLSSFPEKSAAFWECLGLKMLEAGEEYASMQFRAAASQETFTFFLAKGDGHTALDDDGFNCVAFISNSAAKERRILAENGYVVSDLEEFLANGKPLVVFFVRGPGGEIVEIIGTEKIARWWENEV